MRIGGGQDAEYSDAELFLLHLFQGMRSISSITMPGWREKWTFTLGEDPQQTLDRFLQLGLLAPADVGRTLSAILKVEEIKEVLRQRQLPLSGAKAALLTRLMESDPDGCKMLAAGKDFLICTEAGDRLANDYAIDRKKRREKTTNGAVAALQIGNIDEAVNAVYEFNKHEAMLPGVSFGMALTPPGRARSGNPQADAMAASQREHLQHLTEMTFPAILSDIDVNHRSALIVAAALSILGLEGASKAFLDGLELKGHLKSAVATRMCVFAANNHRRLAQMKSAGINCAKILVDSQGCPECQHLQNVVYALDNLPELPNPACTCELGCRCSVVADFGELGPQ